jgi:O-antigen ligase
MLHTPPPLALLATLAFIVFLFRRDLREEPQMSRALWLPLIWMFLLGSRFVSQWLNIFGFSLGAATLEEGSPLDALTFLVLLIAGIRVLRQRGVNLAEFVQNNRVLTFFFIYCFFAIFWSDFPFVSFKRWIKILGHPIMVLIVYTEPDPEQALTRLLKWTGYILAPVSVLFIKYYPDIGRGFDQWTGDPMNVGITADKNALGHDCMVLGIFLVWYGMKVWRQERTPARRNELAICGLLLGMNAWLIYMAHSMTAAMSLVIGIATLIFVGLPFVDKRAVGVILFGVAVSLAIAELGFGASAHVVEFLGKDSTLTGRTELWQELLKFSINPLIGTGFEGFWLGERFDQISQGHWWQPNQAHNGYLETYLNLGVLGVCFMVILLIVALMRSCNELYRDFELGRFQLGLLSMVVIYNWTEAAFKGLSFVWFVFFLVVIDYPQSRVQRVNELVQTGEVDEGWLAASEKH